MQTQDSGAMSVGPFDGGETIESQGVLFAKTTGESQTHIEIAPTAPRSDQANGLSLETKRRNVLRKMDRNGQNLHRANPPFGRNVGNDGTKSCVGAENGGSGGDDCAFTLPIGGETLRMSGCIGAQFAKIKANRGGGALI